MAGRGPAPKQVRSRPNDTARRDAQVQFLTPDDLIRGPELPESIAWPDQTHKWWETWRRSPLSQSFTETDWDFLLDTAMLHALYWQGETNVAAELRLRVAKFGATPEDRMRLKVQIDVDGAKPKAASRESSVDRRRRLLRVVDGTPA